MSAMFLRAYMLTECWLHARLYIRTHVCFQPVLRWRSTTCLLSNHLFVPVPPPLPSSPPPLHGLACRSEADGVSAGLVVCMRVVYVDTLRSTLNQLRHPDTCAALALVCGCVVAAVVSIRSNWCNGLDASLKANYPPIHFVYHTVTQILVLFSYDVAKHTCEMSLCLSVWPHWIVSKKVSEVYYAWQPTSWPPHPLC